MVPLVALIALNSQSVPTFVDRAKELGLAIGGDLACWVDLDNDGWTDLCASGAAWRNLEGKGFKKLADVGPVVAADFDNDGYADLFAFQSQTLLKNNAGKSFTPVPLPPLPPTVCLGACWGDFNGDSFVDLFIGGYEDWDKDTTYPSLILMNQGGRSFKLAWTESKYRTRGVTACDFNRDGKLDIYTSNYRLQPNQLWLNDGNAAFRDVAGPFNAVATSEGFGGGHSIGACWGDFDSDGEMDLFAGNFAHVDSRGDQPKSRFLRNSGPSKGFHFDDLGTCGVFYQESYASPAAGDFDNDGNLDLFFTTVYGTASFGRPNFPVLFKGDGKFGFTDVTASAKVAQLAPTYQAAWADFNKDGALDLVSAGHLFVNQAPGTDNWVGVRLHGDGKRVNRSAIGSQVRIKLTDRSTRKVRTLTRQVEAGTGQGNQNDLTLHFGLGKRRGTLELQILWPDGTKQKVNRVSAGRIVDVRYSR